MAVDLCTGGFPSVSLFVICRFCIMMFVVYLGKERSHPPSPQSFLPRPCAFPYFAHKSFLPTYLVYTKRSSSILALLFPVWRTKATHARPPDKRFSVMDHYE